MSPVTCTTSFEPAKVYCIEIAGNGDEPSRKHLLRFNGQGEPWEDICTGAELRLDPHEIHAVIEVPQSVVDAIKLASEETPLCAEPPAGQGEDTEAWETDIYWDD